MEVQTFGSIVAMEFGRRPSINFADIVEEFDIAFQMVDSRSRALTWDCDDIAIIDRDDVRVALGWLPAKHEDETWHLVIAVGTASAATDAVRIDPNSFRYLADRIVERTQEFLPSTAVLHGDARQPVNARLIDTTFDLLRMNTQEMHGDAGSPRRDRFDRAPDPDSYADMADTMTPPWMGGAQAEDSGAKSSGFTNDLGQMLLTRAAPTKPLRLTIHTLALSLCLYVPPLGAAMFAYTMLRDIFPVAAQAV
ncbi:hypothetical protein A3731_17780 [Roseovarius sp. HI0049]|nr:hypothetical protein A3731_17780 [Roseovarius sp. HI0049]